MSSSHAAYLTPCAGHSTPVLIASEGAAANMQAQRSYRLTFLRTGDSNRAHMHAAKQQHHRVSRQQHASMHADVLLGQPRVVGSNSAVPAETGAAAPMQMQQPSIRRRILCNRYCTPTTEHVIALPLSFPCVRPADVKAQATKAAKAVKKGTFKRSRKPRFSVVFHKPKTLKRSRDPKYTRIR